MFQQVGRRHQSPLEHRSSAPEPGVRRLSLVSAYRTGGTVFTLLAGLILGWYHVGLSWRLISTVSYVAPEALRAMRARCAQGQLLAGVNMKPIVSSYCSHNVHIGRVENNARLSHVKGTGRDAEGVYRYQKFECSPFNQLRSTRLTKQLKNESITQDRCISSH